MVVRLLAASLCVARAAAIALPSRPTSLLDSGHHHQLATKDVDEATILRRMQYWSQQGAPLPSTEKYLLFTIDHGGLNNIRIALELTGVVARRTNRTLVLPPAAPMYLLDFGPWNKAIVGNTRNWTKTTRLEELINLKQLKSVLPTLTAAEFEAETGMPWYLARVQSKARWRRRRPVDVRSATELREGGAAARPRRTADARRAARGWARRSAGRAVRQLSEELLARGRGRWAVAEDALTAVAEARRGGPAAAGAAPRPAHEAWLDGRRPGWRRSAGTSPSTRMPTARALATAGEAALRRVPKGPRLEARVPAEMGSAVEGTRLSPDAAPVVPDGLTFDGSEVPVLDDDSAGPLEEIARVPQGTSAAVDAAADRLVELEDLLAAATAVHTPTAVGRPPAELGVADDGGCDENSCAAAAAGHRPPGPGADGFVGGGVGPAGLAPFAAEGGLAVGAAAAAATRRARDGFDVGLEAAAAVGGESGQDARIGAEGGVVSLGAEPDAADGGAASRRAAGLAGLIAALQASLG
ncbi:unnamed protein product [Prorocentrum cordatum]|uniref:Uncharacterized protein n=1 Tax=Prorocentrum cordatum TaxID=2364126 RepID=A0ABN9PDC4_9DINO|nr:unnamed protein product [Polarella glacialis]